MDTKYSRWIQLLLNIKTYSVTLSFKDRFGRVSFRVGIMHVSHSKTTDPFYQQYYLNDCKPNHFPEVTFYKYRQQ